MNQEDETTQAETFSRSCLETALRSNPQHPPASSRKHASTLTVCGALTLRVLMDLWACVSECLL